jgi:hypothetical protein
MDILKEPPKGPDGKMPKLKVALFDKWCGGKTGARAGGGAAPANFRFVSRRLRG